MPSLFFAYPNRPAARKESVTGAAARIGAIDGFHCITWEQLRGPGRLVVRPILEAIRNADVLIADVTEPNDNVLFEVGFAIGVQRKLWLVRDETLEDANAWWRQLGILAPYEFSRFTNASMLVGEFWTALPHQGKTFFEEEIEAHLKPSNDRSLAYLQSPVDTEAEIKVAPRILAEKKHGVRVSILDPKESPIDALSWSAGKIYESKVVIAHFLQAGRVGAQVHNNRTALLSGLAHGMGKPLLMLAEDEYETPVDYMDLMRKYATGEECLAIVDSWLAENAEELHRRAEEISKQADHLKLAIELRELHLGEYVAELEESELSSYFVRTSEFQEALTTGARIFVGPRGAGKTANLYEASTQLRSDKRNLVVLIKPPSYEFASLVRLVREFREADTKGYLIESIWKFLVYSAIAQVTATQLEARPEEPRPDSPEAEFLEFFRRTPFLNQDFAARLEFAVNGLEGAQRMAGVTAERIAISERLHGGVLAELRRHLGRVLGNRERVAVLVDNLDKNWDKNVDVEESAVFILGLLAAIERIEDEFQREDHWRVPVNVSVTVFLRSDIYDRVREFAPEPDKISVTRMKWSSPELLRRVVEDRYVAQQLDAATPPAEFWERYFPQVVKGLAPDQHILGRIRPRPRDLIRIAKAAVASAVNAKRGVVEVRDLEAAEHEYSQFAAESLVVESSVGLVDFESVLIEFAGATPRLAETEVVQTIERAGVAADMADEYRKRLVSSGFLGYVMNGGAARFIDDPADMPLLDAMARRTRASGGQIEFEIHTAFRRYLEVVEA